MKGPYSKGPHAGRNSIDLQQNQMQYTCSVPSLKIICVWVFF